MLAWVQSWAMPASILMGGSARPGSGSGRPGSVDSQRAAYNARNPRTRLPPWVKAKSRNPRIIDLDAMDTPETVGRMKTMLAFSGIPVANGAKVDRWNREVRARATKYTADDLAARRDAQAAKKPA